MSDTATSPALDPRQDRRARRFARLWAGADRSIDDAIRPAKQALFADLPSTIVEIGSGLGPTFGYLRPGTRVIAFEPNHYFHDDLRARAVEHEIELELHGRPLDAELLGPESQQVVISTLVLCSVPDPAASLDDIWRVLAPGGRLLFIEHVISPPRTPRRVVQRLVRRPWMAIADGCDPCARTHEHLAASRFTIDDEHLEPFGSRFDPTNLTYWGVAGK
jgi:SAM-dependent methyltransferase